jgi:hypothetical protein
MRDVGIISKDIINETIIIALALLILDSSRVLRRPVYPDVETTPIIYCGIVYFRFSICTIPTIGMVENLSISIFTIPNDIYRCASIGVVGCASNEAT